MSQHDGYLHEIEQIASAADERLDRHEGEYHTLKALLDQVTKMVDEYWQHGDRLETEGFFYASLAGAMVGLKGAVMARCPHDPSGYAVDVHRQWEYRGMLHTTVVVTCLRCGIDITHDGADYGYPPVLVDQAEAAD